MRPVSISSWTIVALLAGVAVAAGCFFSMAHYARKETVVGVLTPSVGAPRIVTPRPGVITRVQVTEGQLVEAGQPIATLSLDPVTTHGGSYGAQLEQATDEEGHALRAQLAAHRASTLQQENELRAKRDGLVQRLNQTAQDLELGREHLDVQEQSVESLRILNEKKIVSDLQYRDRLDSVIQARQALSAVEKDRMDTVSAIAETNDEIGRLAADLEESEAQTAGSVAQLDEKRASDAVEREIVLTAPIGGRVVALQAKQGDATGAQAVLAIVLPRGAALQAQLWAPSKAAGFVQVGQKVRLMYDSFPYQRFGVGLGHVVALAKAPTTPAELPTPIATQEALYRIDVALDRQDITAYGKAWPLTPGMRLSADLILDRSSLLGWIFEPLIAASRRGGG